MAEFTVAMKKLDGGNDYAIIEAEHLDMEPNPLIFKGAIPRYYVLTDRSGDEVARFNEKDVAGIFKGSVRIDSRLTGEGGFQIGP
jgi:hypothetical protein